MWRHTVGAFGIILITHLHNIHTLPPTTSAQDAVRALEARLQSANPKVLMLTLTLLEAVVKNGSGGVHALLREHGVVESLGALTNEGQPGGEEVKGAAQELLQLVAATATATASASASPATFVPIQSAAAAAAAAGLGVTPEDAIAAGMAKLEQDLGAVEARVQQLLGLLPTAGPIEEDEALAEVVGFLESCQPRLVRVYVFVYF